MKLWNLRNSYRSITIKNTQLTYISIIGDFSCSEFERDVDGIEPIDEVLGRMLSESDFLFADSIELS